MIFLLQNMPTYRPSPRFDVVQHLAMTCVIIWQLLITYKGCRPCADPGEKKEVAEDIITETTGNVTSETHRKG